MAVSTPKLDRLYYLDWLRVLAILIVFSAHAAMPFQSEPGVWLLQEPRTSLVFSLYVAFFYQWIMNLFFFLAGAGATFALKTRTDSRYISERIQRLLIPLITCSLTLVTLQVYLSRSYMGNFRGTFIEFLQGWVPYCSNSATPFFVDYGCYSGHLWFLGFLFAYTLLTLPFFHWLLSEKGLQLTAWVSALVERKGGLFWFVIPIALIQAALRARFPQHQNFSDFCQWLVYFFYGFVFIQDQRIMHALERYRKVFLITGLICFLGIMLLLGPAGYADAWERHPSFSPGYAFYQILRSVNTWAWVLFSIGIGMKTLNFKSRLLEYGSEAVLPFYILHHPVIISLVFFLASWNPPILIKFPVLGASAFILTLALYELVIRRFSFFRWMFGMRMKRRAHLRPSEV